MTPGAPNPESTVATPGISTRRLTFTYPGASAPALAETDLDVTPGCFLALLGPNGSGKSTLLSLLGGLLQPSAGEVRLGEQPLASFSRARFARTVAFLPARPRVPADYTAREIVLMGRHPFGRGLLLERPADLKSADAALDACDALRFADRPCEELSSGERQRVLLARSLCQDARVLLLDEPTSAQDPAHALDLFSLLANLAKLEGRTVVVASHALNAAARHAMRLVVLREGRLVGDGAPAEVLTRELLGEVFSVEAIVGDDDGVPYAVSRGRRP